MKATKNEVTIAGVLANIRIANLPSTSVELTNSQPTRRTILRTQTILLSTGLQWGWYSEQYCDIQHCKWHALAYQYIAPLWWIGRGRGLLSSSAVKPYRNGSLYLVFVNCRMSHSECECMKCKGGLSHTRRIWRSSSWLCKDSYILRNLHGDASV